MTIILSKKSAEMQRSRTFAAVSDESSRHPFCGRMDLHTAPLYAHHAAACLWTPFSSALNLSSAR